MTFSLEFHQFPFAFPATQEPAWSQKVERWYQLDAAAYGLVQSYFEMRNSLGPKPDLMILASPKASNVTDRAFTASGASSPSKFVHTLANVRGAPLLQVMEWAGPVLCVQDDPRTVLCGIDQAIGYLETDQKLSRVWVLSITESSSGMNANYFILSRDPGPIQISKKPASPEGLRTQTNDMLWLDWVCSQAPGSFNLTGYHQASR